MRENKCKMKWKEINKVNQLKINVKKTLKKKLIKIGQNKIKWIKIKKLLHKIKN